MSVMLAGIVTAVTPHALNALLPIPVKPDPSVTVPPRVVQFSKALLPNDVTELGMVISPVKPEQP
jgi:hypothetical protein